MDSQLDKILKFIRRSGDKVIVLKDDEEFIVSSLDDYTRLLENNKQLNGLSEAQMLDKINSDIALWRQSQKEFNSQGKDIDSAAGFKTPRYHSLDHLAQVEIDDSTEKMIEVDEPSQISQKQIDTRRYDEFKPKPEPELLKEFDIADINEDIENEDIYGDKQGFNFNSGQVPEFNQPFRQKKKDNWPKDNFSTKAENQSEHNVNVNNFGYPNPSDSDENNFSSFDFDNFKAGSDKEDTDYENIPPPPNV